MNSNEASEIIESDKPLIGLMQHFGSGTDALRFFAQHMTHRHDKDSVGTRCCSCKRKSVSRVQAFGWRALVNPAFAFTAQDALFLVLGHVGMTIQHTVVDFTTQHGFCDSCASTVKRNRVLSVAVKAISFFLLLVCLAIVVLGGGGLLVVKSDPKDRSVFLAWFVAGMIGLILSVLGHILERRLRIPQPLRTIGRKPFYLDNVTDVPANRPK